jgi:transcription antitermination factor NusG
LLSSDFLGLRDGEAVKLLNPFTMTPYLSETKWQVLLVRPRSEKKVEKQLNLLGVEACVPTQKLLKRWSDRNKVIDTILFNNYVFVTTPTTHRSAVFDVGNVIKYLSFGGQIANLSERDILLIKKLSNINTPVHITYQSLQKGDLVEIVSGCLMGRQGHIVSLNGEKRIQVEVPNLQCFGQVEMKGVELRKVVF